jgi:hypothetical protein
MDDKHVLPNNNGTNIQIYLVGLCSLTYKILQFLIHLFCYIPIQSVCCFRAHKISTYAMLLLISRRVSHCVIIMFLSSYFNLLFRGTKLTDNTTLFMFLDTQWHTISIRIFMRLAQTQMFKRSNRRFVFILHVGNIVEDSSGNLSTVVSTAAAQETKKIVRMLPTIQSSLLHKTQQSTKIRILLKTL